MRILIYGLNFYPELTGIGKYSGEMAEYLSTTGHEVNVITTPPYYPHWQIQPPYKGYTYKKELWNNVQIFRCPLWVPKKTNGFLRILHLISFVISSIPILFLMLFWKPSVIISVAPSVFTAPFALLFSKISGAKSWLHIQDLELDAAFQLGIIAKKQWLYNIASSLEGWLYSQFHRISTISHRMIDRLLQKGVEKENLVLFPNWIDIKLIKPILGENPLRKEWGIKKECKVILYSGNMGYKQGLEIIIESARELVDQTDILFILCGEGAVKKKLQKYAENLPNVKFFPLQPLARLNELLNLADIHILPQKKDAEDLVMPSKLTGMLASGKAVLTTANLETELGSIISKLGAVTPPGDSKQLKQKILELSRDDQVRKEMGEKGRKWVLNNWEKEKVLSMFNNQLQVIE